MLYPPALPPAPPIISIAIQSDQAVTQLFLEKEKPSFSKQSQLIAEVVAENSGKTTTAKAQTLNSSLKHKETDYLNHQIKLSTQHDETLADILTFYQDLMPEFSPIQTNLISTSSADINLEFRENKSSSNQLIANLPANSKAHTQTASNVSDGTQKLSNYNNTKKSTNEINKAEEPNLVSQPVNHDSNNLAQNIKSLSGSFLVGVIINQREVGNLEIRLDGDAILIPLEEFAEIADFQIVKLNGILQLKTPLGSVDIAETNLKKINNVTYINDTFLKDKLLTQVEFKASDLALIVDLPWRRSSSESGQATPELKPEVRPPSSALSNLRQELYLYRNSGDTNLRSSTLLGGRLAGGTWRVRLNNTFENQPDVAEYFFYKRNGQFRYQVGRQQIGLHPLLNGMNLTGAQIGFSNLPSESFYQSNSAAELLPRRSRPRQTFEGEVSPASFVQLRIAGVIVAQQQVGLNGIYEFVDVNIPVGNTNEIELLVYDRNNLSVPIEIRSLRLNSSDLLLPAGGNVQLAGLGLTGNVIQDSIFNGFNGDAGKPVGFYQFRQGFSENFTFEGAVQAIPDTLQAQAGFVWRLANPAILATSIGTSGGELGYTADLDVDFGQLEILGNSQLFPNGYNSTNQSRDRYNHSLDINYRFSNTFNLGILARSRQNENDSATYILPTFSIIPFSGLSLRGRPDFAGRYLFSAFYQPTSASRLSFNTYGDIYTSDFTYKLNREYQLSLGGEFGGDLASRYTAAVGYSSSRLGGLSWRLGLAYSEGEVGPIAGASMQVLPGLLARVDYQAIPSRTTNQIGGIGDERLTVSLVSDLSFAEGKITPAKYSGLGRERGAIAGRIVVEGKNKHFDLDGAVIQVVNSRNQRIGAVKTDSYGNFFVGNLPEGMYVVEIDPDKLPVELSTIKTSIVAEVGASAVTRLDFPVREEYGVAGKITDAADQPISEVQVELINADGKRVASGVTDEFGLYRFDNVPVGKYTIQVLSQDATAASDNLPKRVVQIKDDFAYDQNLQLPISAAINKK
ncbi:carboxypeptidase regulatory-like domain-containing protein [Pelatocladus sp. BLCC-F211]|uniref:carboxypeptidase regulatory-like domain-containing protein n=1 Tax=Pelatocladus sp. BLCC-F211 TaxID=3342752 RepID=UPI0035BA9BBE